MCTDMFVTEGRKYGTQFEISPPKLGQTGPTSYQFRDQPAKFKVIFYADEFSIPMINLPDVPYVLYIMIIIICVPYLTVKSGMRSIWLSMSTQSRSWRTASHFSFPLNISNIFPKTSKALQIVRDFCYFILSDFQILFLFLP
jgi:hypothetical protein